MSLWRPLSDGVVSRIIENAGLPGPGQPHYAGPASVSIPHIMNESGYQFVMSPASEDRYGR